MPEPEKVRACQSAAPADWESKIKPALAIVGPTAVARKLRMAERSVRAWAAGARRPANPSEVAHTIVAVAHETGLGLPTDEHLRPEEICSELLPRAAAVQAFIVITAAMLAERRGGVRALARAIAGEDGSDLEPTVRRWLALGQSELRPIIELNRIVARLAKFSRSEIRRLRRRIRSRPGPVGDRQAVLAHMSVLNGAEEPLVPTAEETVALPVLLLVVGILASVVRQATGTTTFQHR